MAGSSGEWEFADSPTAFSWKIDPREQAQRDSFASGLQQDEKKYAAGQPVARPYRDQVISGARYPSDITPRGATGSWANSGTGLIAAAGTPMQQPSKVADTGGWEFADEPAPKKKASLFDNILGLGVGITDLIGGAPGAVVSTGIGAAGVLTGEKPSHALAGTMGAMNATLPSSLIGKIPGLSEPTRIKETQGYELGMKPAELIGDALKFIGKGYGEIAKTLGVNENNSTEVSAMTELLFMLGLARSSAGKSKPTVPTPRELRSYYNELLTGKQDIKLNVSPEEVRKGYQTTPVKPENITPEGFAPDLPFGEQRLPTRAPYNILPEEVRARLEAELNPPLEQRVPGQGELFTQERPYQQGELLQGRPPEMTEPSSVRNRPVQDEITLSANDWRVGDTNARQGAPYEMLGGRPDPIKQGDPVQLELVARAEKIAGDIQYEKTLSERGSVGEARARVAEENLRRNEQEKITSEGVPYTAQQTLGLAKDIFKGPGGRQRGAVDPAVLTEGLRKIKDFLTQDRNIMKDDLGSAAIVFRGSMGGKHDPRIGNKLVDDTSYSVFTTDNPYMASAFAGKEQVHPDIARARDADLSSVGPNVTPFVLRPTKIIEFVPDPKSTLKNKPGMVNWWQFDTQAQKLGPGEVLVARKSVDYGPETGKVDPGLNRDRALNDQYAFNDPNVAVPLFEYLAQKERTEPRGPGRKQGGWIGSFDKTAGKQGVAKAILEHRKAFDRDNRPLEQIAKETLDGNVQDISSNQRVLGRLAVPKQMAILTQHPIVKWAVDNISDITRKTANDIKSVLEGDTYKTNSRGFEHRIPGPDGALTGFRKYYHQSKSIRAELSEMKDIWIDNVGKKTLTKDSFRTDRQWETYSAMRKGLDRVVSDLNKAREAAGLKPFNQVENYFPSIWEGDFRVWVKDSTGKLIDVRGAPSAREAAKISAEFSKVDPTLQVEHGPMAKSKYDISDLSAFEEAAKVMERENNPQLAREFNRIYASVVGRRGMGKHGLERKGVGGFLGSESGRVGLNAMERAYESYVTKAYNYIGNIDKTKLYAEVVKLDPKIQKAQANAIDISKSFIDQARSKKEFHNVFDSAIEGLGEMSGLGRNSARRGLKNVSGLVMPYWLLTGKYLMANMVQPVVNMAQLSRLKTTGETSMSPAIAFLEGYKQTIMPDKVAIEGANWAGRQGWLDPTITNLLEFSSEGASTSAGKAAMDRVRYIPGMVEHHMVRLPSFLMYEAALRESIPNKTARFEKAAAMMDDRMVNYSPSNSPLMYSDLGVIGEGLRPLKQYPHNLWGQLLDYAAFTKDTNKVGPLAYFMGTNLAMSGLKGLAFVPEITAVIMFYNWAFNQDIPSPQHMMMEGGIPDALVRGGLSTALGYDISRSVEHPALPLDLLSSPITYAGTSAVTVGNWMTKYLKGTASDADTMKAWLAITPNGLHGWIEELYTPPGGFTPNPNDDMRGVYKRDETEKWMSTLLNMRSNDEAKARDFLRGAKQLLLQDAKQKVEAIEAITDMVSNKKEIPQSLIEKYLKEGGSPERLSRDIKARLENRELSPVERVFKHPDITPDKAHKLERLKQMLDMDLNNKRSQPKSEGGGWEFADEGVTPIGTESKALSGKWHSSIKDKFRNAELAKMPAVGSPGTSDRMPRAAIMRSKRGEKVGDSYI